VAVKNKFKEALVNEGVQQTQLAQKCDISVGTVNRACNSKRIPSSTIRHRMVKVLNELAGAKYHHDDLFSSKR